MNYEHGVDMIVYEDIIRSRMQTGWTRRVFFEERRGVEHTL